ncbi:MAG TPA: hypothetical protein VHP83_14100 [Aggregatilineaceae bacterium]|nr:hypothetical protein [Aggregatilineaceae bacterium]
MMINMVIDVVDDKLRARRSEARNTPPKYSYDIEGRQVNVWVDIKGIDPDEIYDLVWVTTLNTAQNWR